MIRFSIQRALYITGIGIGIGDARDSADLPHIRNPRHIGRVFEGGVPPGDGHGLGLVGDPSLVSGPGKSSDFAPALAVVIAFIAAFLPGSWTTGGRGPVAGRPVFDAYEHPRPGTGPGGSANDSHRPSAGSNSRSLGADGTGRPGCGRQYGSGESANL